MFVDSSFGMKKTYTYYIKFPYYEYVDYLKSIGKYDIGEDPIADRYLTIEEVESIWGLQFFYPDGRTQQWYEDNEWWESDELSADFMKIDGTIDLDRPPLHNGIPLKSDKLYVLECVEDEDVPHKLFSHRIVKSRIKGLCEWNFFDVF